MSNTLNLFETNNSPTLSLSSTIVTLLDSYTKEIVNFRKVTSGSPVVDGVMFIQDVNSNIYERIYNGVINPLWFGSTRTSTELQAAINAAKENDTILIQGQFDCPTKLTIAKAVTLRGQNYVNGNDPGDHENSFIYFWNDTDICIDATANLNLKNLTITGSNEKTEIGVKVDNKSLTLDSVTIQSFKTGIEITNGYYNKFVNSAIVYCKTCIVLNNCYNTNATSISIGAGYAHLPNTPNGPNSKGIILNDGSSLNMFGGSVEGFSETGIELSASRASCFGTYFEGVYDEVNENTSIKILDNNCRLTATNCHVYLKAGTANSFVHIPSTVSSAYIHSKNNYFEYEPVNEWYTAVYRFAATDFSNYNIDISGDNYQDDLVTGSSYISITSSLLQKGNGIIQIVYPSGHELAGICLSNLNTILPYQYNDDISKLQNGTITTFRNNGGGNDDPLNLHSKPYGYNPYTVVLENGEWKKIPKLD